MKHIKINPLCIVVLAIVWLTDSILPFLVNYLSLLLHELVHLLFLCQHKIIVKEVILEPFGICLKTENEPPDSPLVYLSAPIFNLILAGGLYYSAIRFQTPFCGDFFFANLFLGGINLLPCLPLDGGRALSGYLCKKYGEAYADDKLKWVSFSLASCLIAAGLWIFWKTGYNFSLAMIGIFLFYYCLTENKLTVSKSLTTVYRRQEKGSFATDLPISYIGANWDFPAHKLISRFHGDTYYLVHVMKNGTVLKTVTETQLIEKILASRHTVLLHEC